MLILGNHPELEPVAEYFQIPFHCVPIAPETRIEAEQRQMEILRQAEVDLIVLARYMQVLSPSFVNGYRNRIINIHHSFLPAFVGASRTTRLFNRGVKIIGHKSLCDGEPRSRSHYRTGLLRVTHQDAVPDMIQKGKNLERLVLSRAVKLHLNIRYGIWK